jgi:hypothetical protein
MPLSLTEEVVDVYFQKKGYLTFKNLPYLAKRSSKKQAGNFDIDVLAMCKEEIVIISCKRSLKKNGERQELERFGMAEDYLKKNEKWKDLLENRRVEKMYVAEYITEENRDRFFGKVCVMDLKELLIDLTDVLEKEMGPKKLDGAETRVLPRILKFMIKNGLVRTTPNPLNLRHSKNSP